MIDDTTIKFDNNCIYSYNIVTHLRGWKFIFYFIHMEKTKLLIAWVAILALGFVAWYQVSQKGMLEEVWFVAQQVVPAWVTTKWSSPTTTTTAAPGATTKWSSPTTTTTAAPGVTKWTSPIPTTTSTASATCVTRLDMNGDGIVNSADRLIITTTTTQKLPVKWPLTVRDTNKNGLIDISELQAYNTSFLTFTSSGGKNC